MSNTELAPLFRVEGGPVLPAGSADWVIARSGRRLRAALFEPPVERRGSIVLSPGRTEPIEKYGEVVSDLVGRGFVVLVHDWAGQGLSHRFQSDRMRGDIEGGADAFVADYGDVVGAFALRLPRPWIAMGHSMGGALTALALTESDLKFDAAALCAPMMEFSAGGLPIALAEVVVGCALRLGLGKRLPRPQADPVEVPFETNVLTHDRPRYERTLALYRACPDLRLGEPTWRWLSFGLDLRARLALPGAAERISVPVLVVGAGADRVVHVAPIRRFSDRLPRGKYLELAGAFHEILMERDEHRNRFFDAFDDFAAEIVAQRAR
ncbi:MAG TPA: alpha/beta hydrolase [Polyangiaceae bacterium]|nr:alpha/beta hydrolase [Polyangiaceae bacterium]